MVVLLSTTIISCSQLLGIYRRLQSVTFLNHQQKKEIINEVLKVIPSCPIIIDNNQKEKK